MGRRPLAHPHGCIPVSSSILVPAPARRPASAAYLGLRQVPWSRRRIPRGPAAGRRMLCGDRLRGPPRSAPPPAPPLCPPPPRLRPRCPAPSPPRLSHKEQEMAAARGLRVRPSARRAHPDLRLGLPPAPASCPALGMDKGVRIVPRPGMAGKHTCSGGRTEAWGSLRIPFDTTLFPSTYLSSSYLSSTNLVPSALPGAAYARVYRSLPFGGLSSTRRDRACVIHPANVQLP